MNHQPSFISESNIVTALGKAAINSSMKLTEVVPDEIINESP